MKTFSMLLGALFLMAGCASGSDEPSDKTYGETDRTEKSEQSLNGAQIPQEELDYNRPRKDVREEIMNPIPEPGPQKVAVEVEAIDGE